MSINREPLIDLSESLGLTDSPDMPISIGDAVLMRSEGHGWDICIFMGYEDTTTDGHPFRNGARVWYQMIAPLAGNESKAGTDDDCHGLIDETWMREKGLIE